MKIVTARCLFVVSCVRKKYCDTTRRLETRQFRTVRKEADKCVIETNYITIATNITKDCLFIFFTFVHMWLFSTGILDCDLICSHQKLFPLKQKKLNVALLFCKILKRPRLNLKVNLMDLKSPLLFVPYDP